MNKLFAKLYICFCLLVAAFLIWQLPQAQRIQTDLHTLLPVDHHLSAAWQAADAANEQLLNGQILIAVGANQADHAFQAAAHLAQQWQQSGLFSQVDSSITPNINQLRHDIQQLSLATLPDTIVQQIHHNPQAYFQQRAEDAANPFNHNLLPLEQDWLGFGRFFTQQQRSNMQWQPDTGMLYTEQDHKTWVWLRAKLPPQPQLSPLLLLLAQSQQHAQQNQYKILATGGALYSAYAKAQAERESNLMSLAGLLLTFGLLWWAFRNKRIFTLLIPLSIGIIMGLAATLLTFQSIHILTIVIGTSLVGVLVDFPLHWLATALFQRRHWHAQHSIRQLLPTFSIGLSITIIGYLLLWFTPLPILQQTAIFSTAALLGALAATVWLLPPLFTHYQAHPNPFICHITLLARQLRTHHHRPRSPLRFYLLASFIILISALGVYQTNWQDDIRNWIALPPHLLQQSQHIAQLSNIETSGRFILIQADNPDQLLLANRQLAHTLQQYNITHQHIHALHQWVLPESEQRALQQQLTQLISQPHHYAALKQIGIPTNTLQQALHEAANRPIISLANSLRTPLAETWQALYLGRIQNQHASIMRVHKLSEHQWQQLQQQLFPHNQAHCTPHGCAHLIDKRTHLNAQFQQTRNQAIYFKLLSFALAWFILWHFFGKQRGSLILAIPLSALFITIGLLGWFNIPISLFAMFGLLLTTAIGVDYTIYTLTAPESYTTRLGGITLAAATTSISFGLLSFSSTPAVAAFGLTVASGCLINWILNLALINHTIQRG